MGFDEDLEPRKRKPAQLQLDNLSVAELKALIDEHEAEIARIRVAIEAKEKHLAAAAGLFRGAGE